MITRSGHNRAWQASPWWKSIKWKINWGKQTPAVTWSHLFSLFLQNGLCNTAQLSTWWTGESGGRVGGYGKCMFYVASNPIWQQILGKNKSLLKLWFHWRHWTIKSNPQPQLQAAHQQEPKIWILNAQSFFSPLWSSHQIISLIQIRQAFNVVPAGESLIQTTHQSHALLATSSQMEKSKNQFLCWHLVTRW